MVHSAFSTKGQLHTLIFRNSSVWDLYPDSRISSERCAAFYLFILNLSFCNLIPTVHGDLGLLIWIFQCGALAADLTIGIVPTTCWPLSIYSYVHTNQISCSPFRSSPPFRRMTVQMGKCVHRNWCFLGGGRQKEHTSASSTKTGGCLSLSYSISPSANRANSMYFNVSCSTWRLSIDRPSNGRNRLSATRFSEVLLIFAKLWNQHQRIKNYDQSN